MRRSFGQISAVMLVGWAIIILISLRLRVGHYFPKVHMQDHQGFRGNWVVGLSLSRWCLRLGKELWEASGSLGAVSETVNYEPAFEPSRKRH